MVRECKNSVILRVQKTADRIAARLDNVKIYKKFLLILLTCVLMPIILSSIALTALTNNYVNSRDRMNVKNTTDNMLTVIGNVFDEAIIISNTIASSNDIITAADTEFSSRLEYYQYAESRNFRNYAEIYVTQRDYVDNAGVYLYNDTVSSGGVIWRIDNSVKEEKWYKAAEKSDNMVTLCTDRRVEMFEDIRNSDKSPVISVVRRITRGVATGKNMGFVKVDISLDRLADKMRIDGGDVKFYLMSYNEDVAYDPKLKEFVYGAERFRDSMSGRKYITLESNLGSANYMDGWKLLSVYDISENGANQARNIAIIIAINLAVGFLMMLVVLFIYRSFSRRLDVMSEAMRSAENGEFKTVSIEAGEDEIGALTRTYNHMSERINTLINDVYKLEINNKTIEAEKAKAELNFLQSQVNPHFIFNVLNAMLVVSVKKGYTDLSEQISGLAKMFRRLLDWSEEYEPLSNEMGFIETYLKLEKFRFGDKFCYDISMNPEAGECGIPKMIVQPLVENACRHGLQGMTDKRRLGVSAVFEDNILTISVCDNGKGIEPDKLKELVSGLEEEGFEGHIGLKNVYKRLKIYYGDRAGMTIDSTPGRGTKIIIRIDYGEKGDSDV